MKAPKVVNYGMKVKWAAAYKSCSVLCGEDYCTLSNDGAPCELGYTDYCTNCDVGFVRKGNKAVCPYCDFTVKVEV